MSRSPVSNVVGSLTLDQRLDRVGQHVVRARIFWDLWSYFEKDDSRRKIVGTMREYNEFFRFAPHAYLTTYIIYMAGVFDKTKGTISLPHLIRELKKVGKLKSEDAECVDALMIRANPLAEKAAILRNRAFAHRSAHMSYDEAFQAASVTPDQLRELTDLSLAIANRLLVASGISEQSFTELPRDDAEAMMEALKKK